MEPEEEKKSATPPKPDEEPKKERETKRDETKIIIRSYPKVIYLYPTFILSILFGILRIFNVMPELLGLIFVLVLAFNLLAISVDITRFASISILLFMLVLVLVGILLNQHFNFLAGVRQFFLSLKIDPGYRFYFALAFIMAVIYGIVFVDTRFDYWEINSNELLHHHGFLGDVERFPVLNLQQKKEIPDVFEFILLLAGRLILYPSTSHRPIILENVIRINRVEEQLKEIQDSLKVTIEKE